MQSKTDPKPSSPASKTDNIGTAIEDTQLLLQHVAETGIVISEHDLSVLIDSKFSYRNGTLNAESEHLFWRSFTNVTRVIKPVTIQSLRAIHQSPKKHRKPVEANLNKVVSRYRFLAIVSLVALLVIQIYLIIGVAAKTKAGELFAQKEAIKTKIVEVKDFKDLKEIKHKEVAQDDHDIKALQFQYKEIEQKQDANYELLREWNKVWLTLLWENEFQGKIREYREVDYENQFQILGGKIELVKESMQSQSESAVNRHKGLHALEEILRTKRLEREHDITRNRFFLNTLASEYAIVALERYILPLLYGLLGAVFFVLRTLSKEVQSLTYLPMTEINYRLRIPTGALAGLTMSWFFTGDSLGFSLSGFAVSFLVGYNVELLFFLMDKIVSQMTGKNSGLESVPFQSQPVSRDSDSGSVLYRSQPVSRDSGSEPVPSQLQPANKSSGAESVPSQSQPASKDSQKP